MVKITFMGAGSTVFVKNIIGDCMCVPDLRGSTIALYDIDRQRLQDSKLMLENINRNLKAEMTIEAYFGVDERKKALHGADFVFNAVHTKLLGIIPVHTHHLNLKRHIEFHTTNHSPITKN